MSVDYPKTHDPAPVFVRQSGPEVSVSTSVFWTR